MKRVISLALTVCILGNITMMNGLLLTEAAENKITTTYNFNNSDANDSGTTNYTGILIGNPEFVTGRTGDAGDYAIKLDGNNYIKIASDALKQDGSFSVSYWIKMDSTDYKKGMQRILSTGVPENGMMSTIYNEDAATTYAGAGVGGTSYATILEKTPITLIDGNWHSVYSVFNNETHKFFVYIDGALLQLNDYPAGANTTPSYSISAIGGAFNGSFSEGFKGCIDDVNIINKALTVSEITASNSNTGESDKVLLAPNSNCDLSYEIEGNQVEVKAVPKDGFMVNTLYYITNEGDMVQIDGSSFVLPDEVVTVFVTLCSKDTYADKFNALNNLVSNNKGKALIIGDSWMELWKTTSYSDLYPMETVNLGIGGTKVTDWMNYIDLLKSFNPTAIIVHVGDNDMNGGGITMSKTVGDSANLIISYLQTLKQELNIPIYYISLGLGVDDARKSVQNVRIAANVPIKNFCDSTDGITYVDITTPLLESAPEGSVYPDPSLYLADGNHLNTSGYKVILPSIQSALGVTGSNNINTVKMNSLEEYSYYTFDNNTAIDSGTGKIDGVAVGNVVYTDGHNGKGILLDGSSYIKIDTDMINSSTGLTVGFWTKVASLSPNTDKVNRIISTGFWGGGETGFMVGTYTQSANKVTNIISGIGSVTPVLNWSDSLSYIADDTWHYVTAVLNSETKMTTIYYDGALVSKYDFPMGSSMLTTSDQTAIGGYLDLSGIFNEGFVGCLDDVVIIKSAFSQDYVAKLITGTIWNKSDNHSSTDNSSTDNNNQIIPSPEITNNDNVSHNNQTIPSPETSDNFSLLLFILMAVIGIVMFGISIILKKTVQKRAK